MFDLIKKFVNKGGKETVAKGFWYGSAESGVHAHAIKRNMLESCVDGGHCHWFAVRASNGQLIYLRTEEDGVHEHSMSEEGANVLNSEVSDHEHVIRIPYDIVLADGTELNEGDVLMTEFDGAHGHGADMIETSNLDGAHAHAVTIGTETVKTFLLPEILGMYGQIDQRWTSPLPPASRLVSGWMMASSCGEMVSSYIGQSICKESDALLAAAFGEEIEEREVIFKDSDIHELLFDQEEFGEDDIEEYIQKMGYEWDKGSVKKNDAGYSYRIAGAENFEKDSMTKLRLSKGVCAMVGKKMAKEADDVEKGGPGSGRHAEGGSKDERSANRSANLSAAASTRAATNRRSRSMREAKGKAQSARLAAATAAVAARGHATTGRAGAANVRRQMQADSNRAARLSSKKESELTEEFQLERVYKDAEKNQVVLGIVLEPDTIDEQGDTLDAATIEKAAHNYNATSRVVKFRHNDVIKEAKIVESYIAPADFEIDGRSGPEKIKKGTWLVAIHVADEELWKDVEAGKIDGLSVGGEGVRTPV